MKKLLFLLMFPLTIIGQQYLNKDFNDLSLTSGGWTTQIIIDTTNWLVESFGGDDFVKITNYNNGNVPANTWYISPALNLSSSTQPLLSFETIMKWPGPSLILHISTDYVFAGTGETPWRPNDTTTPQNAYGRSKLAGEIGIRNSGAVHAIVRTSGVVSAFGTNFVKSMLRLSETRDALNVVADQICGPTPASDLASACKKMACELIQDPTKSGTYHFSSAPDVTWAEFATEIFRQAGKSVSVIPIPSADYPTPANRPLNSRMNCSETEQVFGIVRPDWRSGLNKIIRDLEATS